MVRKGKTTIRYRTKRVRARVRHPKTHSILGTFLGAYGLALPFIAHTPNGGPSILLMATDPYANINTKINRISYNLLPQIENNWTKMLGYALAGAFVSYIGKKYLKGTEISKHWRIV